MTPLLAPHPYLQRRREEIRRLNSQGLSDSEIGRRLKLSVPWVNRIRRELNLPRRDTGARGRSWDVGRAKALYGQGLTDREIALEIGVSRESIQKWRVKEGLRSKSRPPASKAQR